jgi:ABC-type polysaccharide/polyol phosphate export permease
LEPSAHPVKDLWPPLSKMAILAPMLVVVQISLGAGFRHNAMGVVWHILNAGIVLLLIMVAGVCLLRQYPEHPAHVLTGSLVLAATVVLALELRRSEQSQTGQ